MFHVGPTNSGKTHGALQALMASSRGTYASPLRMLANEAYERLAGHLGEERVGLVTGEERVNETAPIVCHRRDDPDVGRPASARRGPVGGRPGSGMGMDTVAARR